MVRQSDIEITVIKEEIYYTRIPCEPGDTVCHVGPPREAVGSERIRGKHGQEPLLWFPLEGTGDKVNRFRIGYLE